MKQPKPAKPIVAWSYSALNSFETCPKKHWHTRIKKDYKDEMSKSGQEGFDNHAHFEKYMMEDKPLPMGLLQHKPILDKLKAAPGQAYGEQQLAIDMNYEPCGWKEWNTVYGRAAIDYMKVSGPTAVIIDWKFGKKKHDFTQLQLCAAFVSVFQPEVEEFRCGFYWAQTREFTWEVIKREEVINVWNGLIPRIRALEDAVKTTTFPAVESGLCKQYCPVTDCAYNGRND